MLEKKKLKKKQTEIKCIHWKMEAVEKTGIAESMQEIKASLAIWYLCWGFCKFPAYFNTQGNWVLLPEYTQ